MSGNTGTAFEELYSSGGPATVTTPTAGAVSLIAGLPPIVVPGNYMTKLGAQCSSLRLKMGGQLTTTATIPTWLFGLQFTSAQPPAFVASAPAVLAATAAFTPGTAVTAAWWEAEWHIVNRTMSPGAASTVVTTGRIECPAAFPPVAYSAIAGNMVLAPATNVAATNATWESDLQYFLWPYLTLGAATAGNTVTTQWAKLYGEN